MIFDTEWFLLLLEYSSIFFVLEKRTSIANHETQVSDGSIWITISSKCTTIHYVSSNARTTREFN
jgi:hypothetical protein